MQEAAEEQSCGLKADQPCGNTRRALPRKVVHRDRDEHHPERGDADLRDAQRVLRQVRDLNCTANTQSWSRVVNASMKSRMGDAELLRARATPSGTGAHLRRAGCASSQASRRPIVAAMWTPSVVRIGTPIVQLRARAAQPAVEREQPAADEQRDNDERLGVVDRGVAGHPSLEEPEASHHQAAERAGNQDHGGGEPATAIERTAVTHARRDATRGDERRPLGRRHRAREDSRIGIRTRAPGLSATRRAAPPATGCPARTAVPAPSPTRAPRGRREPRRREAPSP